VYAVDHDQPLPQNNKSLKEKLNELFVQIPSMHVPGKTLYNSEEAKRLFNKLIADFPQGHLSTSLTQKMSSIMDDEERNKKEKTYHDGDEGALYIEDRRINEISQSLSQVDEQLKKFIGSNQINKQIIEAVSNFTVNDNFKLVNPSNRILLELTTEGLSGAKQEPATQSEHERHLDNLSQGGTYFETWVQQNIEKIPNPNRDGAFCYSYKSVLSAIGPLIESCIPSNLDHSELSNSIKEQVKSELQQSLISDQYTEMNVILQCIQIVERAHQYIQKIKGSLIKNIIPALTLDEKGDLCFPHDKHIMLRSEGLAVETNQNRVEEANKLNEVLNHLTQLLGQGAPAAEGEKV
jgi:hypothetical protein